MFGEKPRIQKAENALTSEEVIIVRNYYFQFTHEKEKIIVLKSALLKEYPALKGRVKTAFLRNIVKTMNALRDETERLMIELVNKKEYANITAIKVDLASKYKKYAPKVVNKYETFIKFKNTVKVDLKIIK